jgi:glycosyltransferase involved in cell wall biosynthesis
LAILRSRGVPADLTIIGEGAARPMLEALIRELGLTDSVRMLGALDEDRVRAELEDADAFALASHEEAIGVATMEAMALSLPVVVTRVGGVPELVRDGVDGLLVPAQDPEAMAAALQRLYEQPELAARLAASAAARIRASFSSRVSAERIARRLGALV